MATDKKESIEPGAPALSAQAPPQLEVLDFTTSPNWGIGGRYIINPKGERVPAPTEE